MKAAGALDPSPKGPDGRGAGVRGSPLQTKVALNSSRIRFKTEIVANLAHSFMKTIASNRFSS